MPPFWAGPAVTFTLMGEQKIRAFCALRNWLGQESLVFLAACRSAWCQPGSGRGCAVAVVEGAARAQRERIQFDLIRVSGKPPYARFRAYAFRSGRLPVYIAVMNGRWTRPAKSWSASREIWSRMRRWPSAGSRRILIIEA